MIVSKLILTSRLYSRNIHSIRLYSNKNPFSKTWKVLSNDLPSVRSNKRDVDLCPEHADVVVIGGGFIGSSVAYWLKTRASDGLSVVVLEKDFTYKEAQNNVSLGTLTQHFSLLENIHLSKFSVEFLRNIKEHLGGEVNVQYTPTGSLILASENYASKLEENITKLQELGVKYNILTAAHIKEKFPWINTEDVKLGCMGVQGEGTFNSWALLKGLVQKSKDLGTTYVNAEVTGFELERQRDVLMEGVTPGSYERINRVVYRTKDNEEYSIKFAVCVLAAGDESGNIAKLAKVGTSDGLLNIALPVTQRLEQVYSVEGANLDMATPMVLDTTGLWLTKNGLENKHIFGNPQLSTDTTNVSESQHFEDIIKPSVINRVPCYANSKINKIKCEIHDCNTFDGTGIIGPHPYHNNLYIATGFGKLGCQQSPGIGRSIAELIIDSHFITVDLTRFGFDRFLVNDPLVEFNVY